MFSYNYSSIIVDFYSYILIYYDNYGEGLFFLPLLTAEEVFLYYLLHTIFISSISLFWLFWIRLYKLIILLFNVFIYSLNISFFANSFKHSFNSLFTLFYISLFLLSWSSNCLNLFISFSKLVILILNLLFSTEHNLLFDYILDANSSIILSFTCLN